MGATTKVIVVANPIVALDLEWLVRLCTNALDFAALGPTSLCNQIVIKLAKTQV